ncbi:superoxide dismutase family protein [Kocuria turfanensis]|uniref:Superoxide dismutase [Cu-Zn] n=1 Tax=Kocuria turfanensis TaxID=388357 RepID=A0A512IFZ2_9MICC|nr:superoxide dismutase family protein [Kocuria turfanensis]GEO96621.1 superoxide dismutase [Cu-Zn] [Kocuria turfanensis]
MRRSVLAAAAVPAVLLLAGCGDGSGGAVVEESTAAAEAGAASQAVLRDAEGTEVGTVQFSEVSAGTEVVAQVEGLDPGFYGLHVHGTGLCETDSAAPGDPGTTGDFLSAGGHLGGDSADHPGHTGDLTSVYVTQDGLGFLTTVTDRFRVEDLAADEDGSAVILHSGPDNFANVPERYAPEGPDESTLRTGDAGSRQACGAVE